MRSFRFSDFSRATNIHEKTVQKPGKQRDTKEKPKQRCIHHHTWATLAHKHTRVKWQTQTIGKPQNTWMRALVAEVVAAWLHNPSRIAVNWRKWKLTLFWGTNSVSLSSRSVAFFSVFGAAHWWWNYVAILLQIFIITRWYMSRNCISVAFVCSFPFDSKRTLNENFSNK